MNMKQKLLLDKNYIYSSDFKINEDKKQCSYFNAFLLINFGIEITNPQYVTQETLTNIDEIFSLKVPEPFYSSPQDTKYFSCEELLIEQVVAYFFGYGTNLKRIELFKKTLPNKFVVGDEIKLRTYTIIGDEQANIVLKQTMKDMCAYKRPFSTIEKNEFLYLYDEGYFDDKWDIDCKDNIFLLLPKNIELAKRLDKKDLVKYSIALFGEYETGLDEVYDKYKDKEEVKTLVNALPFIKDCPLTKRQAKYYNKLLKLITGTKGKETNAKSPYSTLIRHIKNGDPVGAALYLSNQGSLLERNLKFLLSRAEDEEQISIILDLIDDKNPTLLLQLYTALLDDYVGYPRLFKFARLNVMKSHIETQAEMKARQSNLPEYHKYVLKSILMRKIENYYKSLPKVGKIYISEQFKKVAVPINTSICGKGIDVLPSGSRIPFDGRYLRIFCHWEGIRDIDASLVVLKEEEMYGPLKVLKKNFLSWRTYANKPFGNDALCSGDDTSMNGAEYQDIDIDGLVKKGYRYAFACINGYGGRFNVGTIIQGVQIKNEINTEPWDPKNIEFQMNIVGDCYSFTGFAVDLEKKEIIIINTLSDCGPEVQAEQVNISRRFVLDYYLDFNMYSLLSCLGEVVKNPDSADVIFDKDYIAVNENQKVIRPYDISSLITFVNMKRE